MELLDIVDENGIPTGKTVERTKAHAEGIRHRTSHVWIARDKNGILEVLLQKRSDDKDSYPGCYDISSAGHIPAGSDFIPSAIRELNEELGVKASPQDLFLCGQRRFEFNSCFHGKRFCDDQVSNVYVMMLDRDEKDFVLQKEEVSSVKWIGIDDCLQRIADDSVPNCIFPEELEMVRKALYLYKEIT